MAIKILQGDCIEKMRELPDECVHCCVTSPPYFGLRSYLAKDDPLKVHEAGTEQTPEVYVQKMASVFREVRRVLRDDGVLWLNLGDSYAGSMKGWSPSGYAYGGPKQQTNVGSMGLKPARPKEIGCKAKDLIGIPHRVAFALQADGWYLRAICPWLKRNGMPESCRDRPTQVIEYIFLLTKSQRYFYDSEATKCEGVCPAGTKGAKGSTTRASEEGVNTRPSEYRVYDGRRLRRSSDWFFEGLIQDEDGSPIAFNVNTKPYTKAHFATFPPKLIEPCILAGTSAHGCCANCEAPWERIVERRRLNRTELPANDPRYRPNTYDGAYGEINGKGDAGYTFSTTTGWQATCKCNAEIEPCVVLDPFGGSGTTGEVAQKHGRNAVLIELNPAYIPLIEERAA